jgi:hypothetical protein
LSLEEAHLKTLYLSGNIRRLKYLGTQVVASKAPKSSQRKKEGGPGGRQGHTFVVTDDVETIAKHEHEGVSEVGIRDPSVQQVMFCRKRGTGQSILTFVRNLAHLKNMEFCRESKELRGEVSITIK